MTLITTTIDTPPDNPSRDDPANFRTKADAYISWQTHQLVPQTNSIISEINIVANEVNDNTLLAVQAQEYTAAIVGAAWWETSPTSYSKGAGAVGSDGYTYISLINSNSGNDPTTDNGTNWKQITGPYPVGSSTTTGSSDIILTHTSEGLQSVIMTTLSKSVILPAATSLRPTTAPFVIFNNGAFDFGIRDNSSNTLLCVVPVGGSVICYLDDDSTADGTWLFHRSNPETKIFPYMPVAWNSSAVPTMKAFVALDANVLIGVYEASDDDGYAVAISATTGAVLSGPLEIFDSVTMTFAKIAILSSSNIFVGCFDSSTTKVKGLVLSYTGGVLSIATSSTDLLTYTSASTVFYVGVLSASQIVLTAEPGSALSMYIITWNGSTLSITSGPTTVDTSAIPPAGLIGLDSTHFLICGGSGNRKVYSCVNNSGTLSVLDTEILPPVVVGTIFEYITYLSDDTTYWYVAIASKVTYNTVNTIKINKTTGVITIISTDSLSIDNDPVGAVCLNENLLLYLTLNTTLKQQEIIAFEWNETQQILKKIGTYPVLKYNTPSPVIAGLVKISDSKVISTYADPDNSLYETTQKIEIIGI